MTLFEYITRSPVAFAKWFLKDKEAMCIDHDEKLYVGMQASVVLFKCDDDGYPIKSEEEGGIHELDGSELAPEFVAELEAALLLTLNVEVNDDGNPIDV